MKVGIVGCGNISPVYLRVAQRFPEIEVVAVADALPELAQERAAQFGIPHVLEVDALLQHPDIEVVLNLTPPESARAPQQSRVASGQACLLREAVRRQPRGGARSAGLGAAARAIHRLRARHCAGRGHSDLPAPHPRGRDWRTCRRKRVYA
jgi:hypothetical protein